MYRVGSPIHGIEEIFFFFDCKHGRKEAAASRRREVREKSASGQPVGVSCSTTGALSTRSSIPTSRGQDAVVIVILVYTTNGESYSNKICLISYSYSW